MNYYVRNSFTKIYFNDDNFIITGGRYNKKIKANKYIVEVLKKTSNLVDEIELLNYIDLKLEINETRGKELILKLLELGFLETNLVYSIEQDQNIKEEDIGIKSLNIPTYFRPKELSNCIKSYHDNFKKNSHEIDYYVFDDTPINKSHENYKSLSEVKKYLKSDIFYIDLEEKKKFIEAVIKECSVEKEIIEFAFMPSNLFSDKRIFMSGANRNCILAYNIGDCFLTADDDSYCLCVENTLSSDIYFSNGRGNIKKQYIQDDDLYKLKYDTSSDVLKNHQYYLGKTLKGILNDKNLNEITLKESLPDNNIFPNNYKFYENSKINFTFNTTFGWPDQTADDVLYDYLNDKNMDYLLGKSNKTVMESAPGDTVYSNPFLLTTTLTGIDNRISICPFMPVYRNEDIHYGYFLNYLNPYSLSAGISASINHKKIKNCNQIQAFYNNFYGDIVLSHILYIILEKFKIGIPNRYLDMNTRKLVFYNSIKEICGKNKDEFTSNLVKLDIDLKKLWTEKRKMLSIINNDIVDMQVSDYFTDYSKFINNDEWENIRKVLILYGDLLLNWDDIMGACYRLKIQGKLPKKII